MIRQSLKRLAATGFAALAVSATAIAPTSATTTAWVLYQNAPPYYPQCGSGQTTYAIYSGPYAGSGKCGTAHSNVYWRDGNVQRHHTFVIAPGGSAWNAVHTTNVSTGATINATGWKSLGGANLTNAIAVGYTNGPGTINLQGVTTTGGRFCNQLRNNAWSGWFAC